MLLLERGLRRIRFKVSLELCWRSLAVKMACGSSRFKAKRMSLLALPVLTHDFAEEVEVKALFDIVLDALSLRLIVLLDIIDQNGQNFLESRIVPPYSS